MRPVAVDPCAAVVSWYQCWTFGVAEDATTTAALTVTLNRRVSVRKGLLHSHRAERLGQLILSVRTVPQNEASTHRMPLPCGGVISVVLQLCCEAPSPWTQPAATPTAAC
eukprot:RCo010416